MSRYARAKENARQKAIEWQLDFNNHNYSYGEISEYTMNIGNYNNDGNGVIFEEE